MPMSLLTVRKVAQRLGCSQALVYQLCAERRIAHLRLGAGRGTIRIAEAEVDAFAERSTVAAFSVSQKLKHIHKKGESLIARPCQTG